jgi:hypothetical protein
MERNTPFNLILCFKASKNIRDKIHVFITVYIPRWRIAYNVAFTASKDLRTTHTH